MSVFTDLNTASKDLSMHMSQGRPGKLGTATICKAPPHAEAKTVVRGVRSQN